MKRNILFFALSLLTVLAIGRGQNTTIELELTKTPQVLTDSAKNVIWNKFLLLNENSWLHIVLKDTWKSNERDRLFVYGEKRCQLIMDFLIEKGVDKNLLKIKKTPYARLEIYKQRGKSANATFITLDSADRQVFTLSNKKGGSFLTKNGNKFVFGPKAFNTKEKEVKVELWEFNKTTEFIKSGFTSTSGSKMICSNGMFQVNTYAKGEKVMLKPEAKVEIKMPEKGFENPATARDYKVFYGNEQNNKIDWKTDSKSKMKFDGLPKKTKSTSISYDYVKLCENLQYLDTALYNEIDNCFALTKTEFESISSKYQLGYISGNDLRHIDNFTTYDAVKETKWGVRIALTDADKQKVNAVKLQLKRKQQAIQIEEIRKKDAVAARQLEAFPVLMDINKLGKINCDRFYNYPETTNMIVKLNDFDFDDLKVYAVFSDIKSVIPGNYYKGDKDGNITFQGMPVGKPILFIAALFKGKEVKFAYVERSILKNDVVVLKLKPYTKKDYELTLSNLIPTS